MEILQVVGKDITVGAFALVAFWLFYKMFFEIHQKYLAALADNTEVLQETTKVLVGIRDNLKDLDHSVSDLTERVEDLENELLKK